MILIHTLLQWPALQELTVYVGGIGHGISFKCSGPNMKDKEIVQGRKLVRVYN